MQDKQPYNKQGKAHGFWEKYYDNGQLYSKGNYIKGLAEGPLEEYYDNGQLYYKGNFIKGEWIGYLEWYNRDGSINQIRFYAR